MADDYVMTRLSQREEDELTELYGGSCIIDNSINRKRRNECIDEDEYDFEMDLFEERTTAGKQRCDFDDRL